MSRRSKRRAARAAARLTTQPTIASANPEAAAEIRSIVKPVEPTVDQPKELSEVDKANLAIAEAKRLKKEAKAKEDVVKAAEAKDKREKDVAKSKASRFTWFQNQRRMHWLRKIKNAESAMTDANERLTYYKAKLAEVEAAAPPKEEPTAPKK